MPRARAVLALLLAVAACGGAADPSDAPLPTLRPGGLVRASPSVFQRVLDSFDGKPVVVNFWATWCEPCKEEMPRLVSAARRYRGRVQFLGVDVEDSARSAREFIRSYGILFPNLADPDGEIRRAEKVVGLPTTQFYRADGELAFVHAGEISSEELQRRLRELVEIGRPPVTPAA